MALDDNKVLVRRYFGEFGSQGKLELADELFAATYFQDRPLPSEIPPGPDRAKWVWSTWRGAFPDWNVEIAELVGEGNCLAARIIARGTHLGELVRPTLYTRVPPTGKPVTLRGTIWFYLENGKIADVVETADFTDLLQAIGVERVVSATGTRR